MLSRIKRAQALTLGKAGCLTYAPRKPVQAPVCRVLRAAQVQPEELCVTEQYDDLLQQAELKTFDLPPGQLQADDGGGSTLQEGERLLQYCIMARPTDMRARILLLRNLMLQEEGREGDVPVLAINTLREAGVENVDISSPACIGVLQITLLGLKALYKLGREELVQDFMGAIQAAVPGMAEDMARISCSLQQHFDGLSEEDRAILLSKRSYSSCVDLQFVTGRHHADAEGLLSMQE